MKYFIHNRYQDGGWEPCVVNDQQSYDRLQDALAVGEACASNSIVYGMVRVVDSSGVIHKTWAAGSGVAPTAPPAVTPAVDATYSILLEDVVGTGAFTKALSLRPDAEDKIPETQALAAHIATQISKEYPGRRVVVQDAKGNIIRTVVFTGVEEEPATAETPAVEVGNLSSGPRPITADGEDEDDDDFDFIDLTPDYSRVNGFEVHGQVFLSVATVDSLIVEMQLNNVKSDDGSYENDFLLKTLRTWLVKAERNIRGLP